MRSTRMFAMLVLVVCITNLSHAVPMGTAWTYQGRLMDTNSVAEGLYDFQFKLFDANVAGTQQGIAIEVNDLDVIDGYFTVELDFSSDVFNGDARWLEILVRPGDSIDVRDYVTLNPRQEVSPTPYALQTRGIFVDGSSNVGIGTTSPTANLEVAGDMKMRIEDDITLSMISGISNSSKIALGQRFNNESAVIELDNTTGILRIGRPYESNSLTIDGSGNVGIGTSNPLYNLHIYDSAGNAYVKIESESGFAFVIADGSKNSGLTMKENGTTKANVYWNTVNDSLSMAEGGADRVVVKGGKVGIRTTNPEADLHVEGDTTMRGDLFVRDILYVSGSYIGTFPRPAYDSGWFAVPPGQAKTLNHNLGGNVDNYLVDLTFRNGNGINHHYYGGMLWMDSRRFGAYWEDLTNTQISVFRLDEDYFAVDLRIRIWIYN